MPTSLFSLLLLCVLSHTFALGYRTKFDGRLQTFSDMLTTAHELARSGFARVTVYEKENCLGGHARTMTVEDADTVVTMHLDLGFMVFNRIPDYHGIIKHPMDFSTIRKKLDKGIPTWSDLRRYSLQ
ncbi:hypothetical protein ZEAMMB73_Zm00001d007182 [Zea mays]|uniref:Uncharacterized protein n=1 Tax=Zea mays TaxID=4577 RepID=A0A1D6F4G5_MAIZE|nr:hypothetical protein ZEAMMB73_Zm00001d007182 [Zea mays]